MTKEEYVVLTTVITKTIEELGDKWDNTSAKCEPMGPIEYYARLSALMAQAVREDPNPDQARALIFRLLPALELTAFLRKQRL